MGLLSFISVTDPDLWIGVIKVCLNSVGNFAILSDKFIRRHNGDKILTALYLIKLVGRSSVFVALFLFKCLSSFSIDILVTY